MKPVRIIFVIIFFTVIFISCSKKEDKQTSSKPNETMSDSAMNHRDYLWDSVLASYNVLTFYFDTTYEKKIKPEKFHRNNVILTGKFNYDKHGGFGHMGVCIAEISEITEIRLLKNQNPDDFLSKEKLLANPQEYNGKIVKVAGFILFNFEGFEIKPVTKK
jgi:hypothetical protein